MASLVLPPYNTRRIEPSKPVVTEKELSKSRYAIMDRRWHRTIIAASVALLAVAWTSQAQVKPAAEQEDESPAEKPASTSQPAGVDLDKPSPVPQDAKPSSDTEEAVPNVIQRPVLPRKTTQPPRPSKVVREPSQGRPIFRMPGDTFYFVMRLEPGVSGDVTFSLRHALEPDVRVPLKAKTPPSYVNDEFCSIIFMIPAHTEPGLYDLEVRTDSTCHYSRRCVKVLNNFKTKFRFVHLSNMNIGDLTAPDFDEMLPKEINIIAPEFIIATGDYTEWSRARDDASSWLKVLKFFEKFNAPVFMLCGLHDHEASFTDFVASKPIDDFDYGNYHGLLLLDHPGNPIDQDYGQLQWVEKDLKQNRDKTFNFIASNSDELGLLDIWRESGDLSAFIKENRIKMLIAGGSTDWDYREFADKLAGLDDFHFIRTHEASTAMRDRATGFSHYRVIEVDGEDVSYVYADETSAEKLQYSIPTGRLRAYYDAPNDGSADHVGVTVQNALNQAFPDARVWLRVAKQRGGGKPTVAPGRLIQTLDAGDHWACNVAIDLPDKSAVRVMASTKGTAIPVARPFEVELEGPDRWVFSQQKTDFGLSYYSSNVPARIKLTNTSNAPQTCYPVIRLNGARVHPDRSICPRLPLVMKPGETIELPLVLNLRRVSRGDHALQVYFLEDPLNRLHTFDVSLASEVRLSGEPGEEP
jgi:hypothetical protein